MAEAQAVIQARELSRSYGSVRAVDSVSFDVRRGEVLGLLGPNGAGKTTTLRMLTCYLAPTSGTITINGMNHAEHRGEIKKLIGYLPESAPIYPEMLVYDYLMFVAALRGMAPAARLPRLKEMADLCGIAEVMHKPVGELSKGYKQRVGLAHAMIGDPEVLVLDEPTSGLDPNQIVEIREIIRQMGRMKTVIFSTHILSEAEATCDRLLIINAGRIVADGSTSELTRGEALGTSIMLTLAGADFDDVSARLGALTSVTGVALMQGTGGAMEVRVTTSAGEGDPRAEVYAAIKQQPWVLLEMKSAGATLEGVFRQLTRNEGEAG